MRKLLSLILLIGMTTMLFAGCGADDPVVAPGEDPVVDDPVDQGPDYGGTLRIALPDVPPGVWNPAFWSAGADNTIIARVFTYLGKTLVSGEIVPLAAEEWSFSDDSKTLTVKLRDDIYFHDGVQLTAADVEFSFKLLAHPDYNGPRHNFVNFLEGYDAYRAGETDVFEGVKVINDFELTFTSKDINAKFIANITAMGIMPKHLLKDVAVADMLNHPFNNSPVGSGPFKFAHHARDQYVAVEANDDYFGGRPYVDEIYFLIRNREVALMEMETGAVDWMMVEAHSIEVVEELEHVRLESFPGHHGTYLFFNLLDPRFDKLTRKGIAHAINRQGIVDDVFEGIGQVTDTPHAPMSWAYHDGLYHYDYNPEKARQFFADAGWVPGTDGILARNGEKLDIELLTIVDAVYERIVSVIKQDLEAVGLKVDLMIIDFPLWIGERLYGRPRPYTADDFDMTMIGLGLGADPDMVPFGHTTGGFNLSLWHNEESDRLLEAGLATVDLDERRAIYLEWQELYNDEMPTLNLRATSYTIAVAKRVQDAEVDWRFFPLDLYRWWIPKELQ